MQAQRPVAFVTGEVLQQAMEEMRRIAATRKPHGTIPKRVTRPHLTRALRGEIKAMFKQGYEVEDVTALLGQHGIEIDTATFRRYWRQTKRNRRVSESAGADR